MTTEEKAERYDKSFERAKEQLNDAKVFDYDNEQIAHDIRTTVYNIFPELKESKDDRIRKEMISWLKGFIGEEEGCGYTEDEIRERIAWLDKQGEHQPAWSEEDKGVLLESISVLQSSSHWVLADKLKSLKDRVGCEVNYTTTSEPVVRENKGNYGEISPNSEWSEEDESMRRHLMLILMELGLSRVKYSTVPKYHFDREIEWLCNLHPQPKEEWSKKDETIKLDWLKSLFPQKQWKPSDEQIKVCKEAFIKKAVEWLSRHFYDEEYQSMDNEGVWICADELIDDFKEYMKGE